MRVKLAEIVSRKATLRSVGSTRLKGACPFHPEKTASFYVDTDKGFYKCFSCGRAGDAITFVRDIEHLTFIAAVEMLGRQFNVAIEYEEGSDDVGARN